MKTVLFIDGSNLYHSLRETGFRPSKVDYHKLFDKISKTKNPVVRFYIAALTKEFSKKDRSSQQAFFSSLKKNPNLTIHFGKLQKTNISFESQMLAIKALNFCKNCANKARTLLINFLPKKFNVCGELKSTSFKA